MGSYASIASWTHVLGTTRAFWIYCGFFVLHELEEWNIAGFEKRVFKGLPAVHTDRNARAWIVLVSLLALVWCAVASMIDDPRLSTAVFLPAIFIAATNGLQHVIWSVRFRAMAPGLVTALLLILPASAGLVGIVVARDLVPLGYVAGLSSLALLALAFTLVSGARMPAFVPVVYGLGDRCARLFMRPASVGRTGAPIGQQGGRP